MKIDLSFSMPEDEELYGKVYQLMQEYYIGLPVPVDPPVVVDPPPVIENPPVEPPVVVPDPEPLIVNTKALVQGGVVLSRYDWSWNTTSVEAEEALKVDIAAWGGFRLKQDPMGLDNVKQVAMSLASNETRLVKIVLNDSGVASEHVIEVRPEWQDYRFLLETGTNLTVTITAVDNQALVLFIGEMSLTDVTEESLGLIHPPIDFFLTTEQIISSTLVLPEAFISTSTTQWLHTNGNKIFKSDESVWQGRGVNIFDTRSCNAMAYNAPNVDEVKRRVDYAVDVLGANFLRLCLESYNVGSGRVHWATALSDPEYFQDLKEILEYIGTKTGTYVLMSLWIDPSLDGFGRPTGVTALSLKYLASAFSNMPHVMFGVCNEPENNYNGTDDATVIQSMQMCYDAIRNVAPDNIISVQGTGGWSRRMSPYVTTPINGTNVVYECHAYNPFDETQWYIPAQSIPVILGEFGVFDEAYGTMTPNDVEITITKANEIGVSWCAWSLHHKCPPNMLVGTGTGANMPFELTEWGKQVAVLLIR